MGILTLATLPFFHDIFTTYDGIRDWVPDLGIANMLKDTYGYPLGYSNYRVLLYNLSIHLAMHLFSLGWFMDARGKDYRPALLFPVGFTFYQLLIIVTGSRFTEYNQLTSKFFVALFLTLVAGFLYFFKNKNEYHPPNQE